MCMCLWMCIRRCVYVYMYVCMYGWLCVWMFVCVRVCVCVYVCTHVWLYLCTYVHIHVCAYVYVCVCVVSVVCMFFFTWDFNVFFFQEENGMVVTTHDPELQWLNMCRLAPQSGSNLEDLCTSNRSLNPFKSALTTMDGHPRGSRQGTRWDDWVLLGTASCCQGFPLWTDRVQVLCSDTCDILRLVVEVVSNLFRLSPDSWPEIHCAGPWYDRRWISIHPWFFIIANLEYSQQVGMEQRLLGIFTLFIFKGTECAVQTGVNNSMQLGFLENKRNFLIGKVVFVWVPLTRTRSFTHTFMGLCPNSLPDYFKISVIGFSMFPPAEGGKMGWGLRKNATYVFRREGVEGWGRKNVIYFFARTCFDIQHNQSVEGSGRMAALKCCHPKSCVRSPVRFTGGVEGEAPHRAEPLVPQASLKG